MEVQLKDAFCTVSGEVTTRCPFTKDEIACFCREAVNRIGYTRDYRSRFGEGNCAEVRISFFDAQNELLETRTEYVPPSRIIDELELRSPGFANRCAKGLFGRE